MANAISRVTLCSVPISPVHQLDFEDSAKQKAYFNSKAASTHSCSFIPRSGSIKLKGYMETFQNCNYGYYENEYEGTLKTYYFFIVKKDYTNRGVTTLTIAIDEFQTWQFNMNLNSCMIEREHVIDDKFGIHTYPEDFELGDYITRSRHEVTELQGNLDFIIGVTDPDNIFGTKINKLYSGVTYRYFRHENMREMNKFIQGLCNKGKADAILFIFSYPSRIIRMMLDDYDGNGETIITNKVLAHQISVKTNGLASFTFNGDTYIPKNNKCFCYPYNFITVKNASGGNVVLKYENFAGVNSENTIFNLDSTISPDPTFSLTPLNYNGRYLSIEDSLEIKGFGLCSWNNDNYSNWWANHSNTINTQSNNAVNNYSTQSKVANNSYNQKMLENATQSKINEMQLGLGMANSLSVDLLAMGGDMLSTYGNYKIANMTNEVGAKGIQTDLQNTNLLNSNNYEMQWKSIMASVKDAMVQPNTAKGDTSGCSLDVVRDTNTFFIERTQVKVEYIKRIDMFFQMFGYQINEVKPVSYKKRKIWDFIKTVNCNCGGNIPRDDIEAINSLFNNGLTVWHVPTNMFNYNQINQIR